MDPSAGVEVLVKMGDEVEKGEPVARLYDGWSTEEGRDAGAGGPEGLGRARRARPWYPGQPVKKLVNQSARRLEGGLSAGHVSYERRRHDSFEQQFAKRRCFRSAL